jgi:predicted nucleotidyltransferase
MSRPETATATPEARERLELAERIAAVYSRAEGVLWIGVAGSVARGEADAWSDLDILILWEAPDDAFLEAAPLKALDAKRIVNVVGASGGRLEQYLIGRLKIDVAHSRREDLDELMRDVFVDGDLTPQSHKALAGFAGTRALFGEAAHARTLSALAGYPDALVRSIVERHLAFFPSWVMNEMCLRRGDWMGFYDYALRAMRDITAILAALNRVFYSAEDEQKGNSAIYAALRIAPSRAWERLQVVLREPTAAAVVDLYALIEETLALVERELPDVDLAPARVRLALDWGGPEQG